MRKLLLALVVTFTLQSCSSDSENRTDNTPQFTGNWKLTAKEVNGLNVPVSDCEDQFNWYRFQTSGAAQKGEATLNSPTGTVFCNQVVYESTYDVDQENNVLTIFKETSTEKYSIIELTANRFKIRKYNIRANSGAEVNIPIQNQVIETCTKQ